MEDIKILNKKFKKLKKMIENKDDIKEEVDGFYFNEKAVRLLENTDRRFFINTYYNLTVADILNIVDDANNLDEVYKVLFEEYNDEYAAAWYENFIYVLQRI